MPTLTALYAPLPGFDAARAAWPVWSNSTPETVRFDKLTRKEAAARYRMAREFDRATKKGGGCQGGAVGVTGLKVLEAMRDFMNYATGQLDPGYAAIARVANISVSAVHTALRRLRALGILVWVRRCDEGWQDGRYVRRQRSNAYSIRPCSEWRGFTPPREPPPPLPGTWGKPDRMPDIHEAAAADRRGGGDAREQVRILELAPPRGIEGALARLGRAMLGRAGK